MHVDEFIFNFCVSSMMSEDIPESLSVSAMNVFSIDENRIRDGNGIIFAEAITCYKCTFCGKMFAAMEVVLTHYQSNHRCSVIPLLKGMENLSVPKASQPKTKSMNGTQNGLKSKPSTKTSMTPTGPKLTSSVETQNTRSVDNECLSNGSRLLRESNKSLKMVYNSMESKKKFKCVYPGCSKGFTSYGGLENHRLSHKRRRPYKCDWNDCKFKCSDLAGLEFHKTTHSGDNPYHCSWPGCDQSFADVVAKEEHLQREHIGDRILACDYPLCEATFKISTERERHKSTHYKTQKPKLKPIARAGVEPKRGRPPFKCKPVIEFTSSSDSGSDSDSDDSEDSDEDINEEVIVSQHKEEDLMIEEPLDLSKTSIGCKSESKPVVKTPAKRGRKPKPKEPMDTGVVIPKKVFRCDYPGCRKTFTESNALKEHEKDTHKTPTSEGRTRHTRKCKGNLYYKI